MLINTVCGNGLGSSLILKINVDKVLGELGVNATVETTDVSSVVSSSADLFVTTTQFESNMQGLNAPVIYVNNVTELKDLKEKLNNYFKEKGEL
ncbi:PTS sugar transporter subunit IIB [Hutsoniella sourekii]